MSEENVEAFKRATEAANRRDIEAALEELDPELEWHPSIQMFLGGEATVYRGHAGVRELLRDLDEVWAQFHPSKPPGLRSRRCRRRTWRPSSAELGRVTVATWRRCSK